MNSSNKPVNNLDSFYDRETGKYGFMDKYGKIVIKPQFDGVESFSGGLAKVNIGAKWKDKEGYLHPRQLREGKWGLVDETGKIICKPQFDYMGKFTEGIAPIEKHGKWGYIDKIGNIIIKPQFAHVGYFSDGLAPVQKIKFPGHLGGHYFVKFCSMVLNMTEKEKPNEELKDYFGGKWGYIDKTGNYVIKPQFNSTFCFNEGLAIVEVGRKWGRTQGKYGYIDKIGKFVINPIFDYAGSFCNGHAIVKWHNVKNEYQKYTGVIDKTGEVVVYTRKFPAGVEMNLDELLSGWQEMTLNIEINYSEGLAPIDVGGKFGYINKTGKFVIKPQFANADDFYEGLARVNIGGRFHDSNFIGGLWGYIDKTGKFIINPQFTGAENFSNGLVRVNIDGRTYQDSKVIDGRWCYIDKTGKFVKDEQTK